MKENLNVSGIYISLSQMLNLALEISEPTTLIQNFTKDNKIERLASGSEIIEHIINTNKHSLEAEDSMNSCTQLKNPLDTENTLKLKMNEINDDSIKNETTFTNFQNQKHHIQSAKLCSNDLNIPSTTLIDQESLGEVNINKLQNEMTLMANSLTHVKDEICNLRGKIYEINKDQENIDIKKNKHIKKNYMLANKSQDENYFLIKQKQSNFKSTNCKENISIVEANLINTINCVGNRIQCFEEYVQCSLKNIKDIISKNKNEDFIKHVHTITLNLEIIKKDLLELKHNNEVTDEHIEAIEDKLELLSIVKANKEEVDEALADKPDICTLNQKVSHDQFNGVCDDLTRILNDTIAKLNQQESICQQLLYELRREFEGNLDKLEIPVLKDFIKKELQALKNQIQLLSETKEEQEAAGAKKHLKNLHCISCNKNAFMETNLNLISSNYSFPCRRSIKPYLTFKMDYIRTNKKMILEKKKLLHLQEIRNGKSQKNNFGITESIRRDTFCNRYTGGSHTILSPQQRITKLTNGTQNYDMYSNVKDMQMIEGVVEGSDGRIYKGRWFIE